MNIFKISKRNNIIAIKKEDFLSSGNITARLKLLFISPLMLSLLALICFFISALYYYQHQKIDHLIEQTKKSSELFYLDSIDYDAKALSTSFNNPCEAYI